MRWGEPRGTLHSHVGGPFPVMAGPFRWARTYAGRGDWLLWGTRQRRSRLRQRSSLRGAYWGWVFSA